MKHVFTLLALALTSCSLAQLPPFVPTDNLVAWFPFDGNTLDVSGNEQHGAATNVSFYSETEGTSNQYAHFNGDAQILVPHHSFWNAEEYTLSMRYRWEANPLATPNGNSLIVSKRPPTGWGSSFEHSPSGGLSWSIGGNGGVGLNSPQPQGEWVQTTWVFGADSIKVYFGTELVQVVASPGPMNFNSLPVSIGMRGNGWHELIGDIDYLGFWSRKLLSEEVMNICLMSSQISGCTDPLSCNYNSEATEDDGSCLPYNADFGCMDPTACNFDVDALCADDSCIYPRFNLSNCDEGEATCGPGTMWDSTTQLCVVANPADTNFDGCVELNDLLDVLSAYGNCGAEDLPWQCGDPLEYQGYDYETVLIGEQCWFAENLKAKNYRDGSIIPVAMSLDEWFEGYGIQCSFNFDEEISANRGLLYNGFAVNDDRKLCPSGWHVPTDEEFMVLEGLLGMSEADIQSIYWRGTNEGTKLRTTSTSYGNYIGTDEVGFNAVPAGTLFEDFGSLNYSLHLWSSTSTSQFYNVYRAVDESPSGIYRSSHIVSDGHSVRCIKDTE